MMFLISFSNRCVTVDSVFTNVSLFCFVEGCTLTANEHHGVRLCPMDMVNKDLEVRNVTSPRLSDKARREKLEYLLREEEEWQQMVMYRRDQRFRTGGLPQDYKLQLDRVVLDMLHCPMRMHEKVLNLLYAEILNGKTKNEATGPRTAVKRKKQVEGEGAVGQEVAKLFENDQGLPVLHRGVVVQFMDDGRSAGYSVAYDDGDGEDLNVSDFREAHKLALLLETDKSKEEARLLKMERKIVNPSLGDLTDVIRDLGSLGESWTHQWEEGNTKALKKIKLPFDQSKKIFHEAQLHTLGRAVDIAVSATRPEHRADWKLMLTHYVHVIGKLTKSEDFSTEDIDSLEIDIDKAVQEKTRQDKPRQDETRRDKNRQDKTREDKTTEDKTTEDKTRQYETRQDKTRQDQT